MRISVIGTGYLGAVHAACMADIGHEVLGVDTDAQKIAALQDGHAPFFEPGLEEILVRAVGSGKLRFSTSLQEAASPASGREAGPAGCRPALAEQLGHPRQHRLEVGRGRSRRSHVEAAASDMYQRCSRISWKISAGGRRRRRPSGIAATTGS